VALKLGAYPACLHDRPLESSYSRLDGLALAAGNLRAAAKLWQAGSGRPGLPCQSKAPRTF
jgi:hypothetical protein